MANLYKIYDLHTINMCSHICVYRCFFKYIFKETYYFWKSNKTDVDVPTHLFRSENVVGRDNT